MQNLNLRVVLHTILFGSTLFVFSCKGKMAKEQTINREDTIPVKVIALQQGTSSAVILASGLFTTDDETALAFKNGGIINKIYVREGDAVSKGQLLATVNLTEVDAGVQQAVLAYEKAERDYQRAAQLYKDSVATLEQMQNAKTGMDVARQQREAARFNKQYSEIRATTSGYVLKRFVNEGQMTGPGTPVLLINGARQGNWLLKVGVSDAQWAAIKTGDKATIRIDALPGKTLNAFVFKKSEGIDPTSGTFNLQLKINDLSMPALASGMFAKAEIVPSQKVTAWSIPYDALLDGDAGKGYVFITNDGKTAKKIPVSIGAVQKDHVQITGGLEQVQSLIVSGSAYLNDGSFIRIQEK